MSLEETELPYTEALAGLREYQAQLARRPIYSSERAGYIESELAEELGGRIDDLEAALRSAEQPKDATGIRRFARDVLEGGFEGAMFDGADLQELGVKHGLLREETVTEPCSTDGCACAEVNFPTTCFRFTEIMQPPKAPEQALRDKRETNPCFCHYEGKPPCPRHGVDVARETVAEPTPSSTISAAEVRSYAPDALFASRPEREEWR